MDRSTVLLSTQRALLGSVTKNMRAITISFTSTEFTLRVYFDSPPSNSEVELMKIITTEIAADCPEFLVFNEEFFISQTKVNQLEMLDVWVYMEYDNYLSS